MTTHDINLDGARSFWALFHIMQQMGRRTNTDHDSSAPVNKSAFGVMHWDKWAGKVSPALEGGCCILFPTKADYQMKNVSDRHWLVCQACDWLLWTDLLLTDEISNTDHLAQSAGKTLDPGSLVAASPKHGCLHLVLSLHLSPNISNELMKPSEDDTTQAGDEFHTRRVKLATRFTGLASSSASPRCLHFGEMGHGKIKYSRKCEETCRHSVK